jgi:hypothetical protein
MVAVDVVFVGIPKDAEHTFQCYVSTTKTTMTA